MVSGKRPLAPNARGTARGAVLYGLTTTSLCRLAPTSGTLPPVYGPGALEQVGPQLRIWAPLFPWLQGPAVEPAAHTCCYAVVVVFLVLIARGCAADNTSGQAQSNRKRAACGPRQPRRVDSLQDQRAHRLGVPGRPVTPLPVGAAAGPQMQFATNN